MKRYKALLIETIDTEENEFFRKQNPYIMPKWIIITKDIIEKVENWYNHNKHPKDIKSIEYWINKNIRDYPPIIIHNYSGKFNIIDGWHRLYAAIQNKNNKILAYIK